MYFPLHPNPDAYTAFRFPPMGAMTGLLMVAMAGTFAVQSFAGDANEEMIRRFGVIPAVLFNGADWDAHVPAPLTLLTAQFLNSGWGHLVGNLFFLWLFGGTVERDLGRVRFVAFYLLVGAVGLLAEAIVYRTSDVALIGASAGISGVLAATLLRRPFAVVTVVLLYVPFRFPMLLTIGGWIILQATGLSQNANGEIAYIAHAAGFVAGAMLFAAFRRSGLGPLTHD